MDILTANDRPGEYPPSWYAATAKRLPRLPAARGSLRADVCVVGGGYTGLSAALHLSERGYDVVLLEAQRLGFGASGRNGGQVGTGQRVGQKALESLVGKERARALWDLSLEAVALVRKLIADRGIRCDFAPGIVHADHRARYVPDTLARVRELNEEYGYEAIRALDREEIRHLVGSPDYHGGSLDMGGGHLHPLAYALGIARAAQAAGARLFEGTRALSVEAGPRALIRAEEVEVSADHVLIACNGYLGNLAPAVAARVMPINNFIAATAPLDAPEKAIRDNRAVVDSRFVVNYFRLSPDGRLLFGGGESYGYRFPRDIETVVRRRMARVFPSLAGVPVTHAWGGTLGITMTRMPHFARLAGNVLSASGYSGHGVAMATLGGKLAAEAIAGQSERFDLMASVPAPRFLGGTALRRPLLAAAMLWYALRDRL